MPALSTVVALEGICLSFAPNIQILKNINFTIAANEKVALTGPSGAGKTSLLAIIAGLLSASSGDIKTLEQSLTTANEEQLAALRRRHIGIIFQHYHLLDTMTALENVMLPLEMTRHPNAAARAAEALASVGLGDRSRHFPWQLSGGEKQRVAIARAFATNPKLLLADEPTGNLDYDTGNEVLDILFERATQRQTAMLFVTHNNEILKRFDKVYNLRGGQLHAMPQNS